MQVFLPVPDFAESLRILDDSRLRKQRVEAFQLLNVLMGRTSTTGWKNHPAAVMFRRYIPALQHYYNLSLAENARRGYNNIKLQPETISDNITMPHWLGDDAIHRTHRSRLMMKGKVDVLANRIKRHHKKSANSWLKSHNFSPLNEIRNDEYAEISALLNSLNAGQSPNANYYSQFGWSEPDHLEYMWPGETPDIPNRVLR